MNEINFIYKGRRQDIIDAEKVLNFSELNALNRNYRANIIDDIKVNISPDNNLAGLSSIGQAVYIGCDGEEKKLTDTGDGIYSGIITNNFEELSIRLTVANFYANCSGEFSIGSN